MTKPTNPAQMTSIKVTVTQQTADALNTMATHKASSRQGLLGPLLTAYADGEIKEGYALVPNDHGNAKNGRRV